MWVNKDYIAWLKNREVSKLLNGFSGFVQRDVLGCWKKKEIESLSETFAFSLKEERLHLKITSLSFIDNQCYTLISSKRADSWHIRGRRYLAICLKICLSLSSHWCYQLQLISTSLFKIKKAWFGPNSFHTVGVTCE